MELVLQTPEILALIRLLLEVLRLHHLPLPVLFLLVVVAVVGHQEPPVETVAQVVVAVQVEEIMAPVELVILHPLLPLKVLMEGLAAAFPVSQVLLEVEAVLVEQVNQAQFKQTKVA